jgi:hypothetical protein
MALNRKKTFFAVVSLFASTGTLFCCALPALLVTLGMGAVVAGAVSAFPGLVWLSENKPLVFSVSGALLIGAGSLRKRGEKGTCPVDPVKAEACGRLKKASAVIYWVSVALYGIGFFFAFLLRFFL